MEGQIVPPNDSKLASGVIEGTFTDLGRGAAGPLSGRASVKLRTRRLEAEHADQLDGPKIQSKAIGSIAHGHSAKFSSIPLGEIAALKVHVSAGGDGGRIEVRSGSVTGPVIGSIEVAPTGAWDKFVELETPLTSPREGRADLYLVFVNPGKGGLMNLDWIEFGKAKK